jgi:hypothetical protein
MENIEIKNKNKTEETDRTYCNEAKFEDTNGVNISHKSKTERQYND